MTNTKNKKFNIPLIPGYIIIYPMVIGVIFNSFVPSFLEMGGFMTAIKNGTGPLVGAFLFFLGASLDIRSTPAAVKRGGIVIITKIALSVAIGLAVAFFFNDSFLGLSSLAIIGGISVANNALYSGITGEFGSDAEKGAVGVTILSVGPIVTMIALSSAGLAAITPGAIIGCVLPLVIGLLVGTANASLKETLTVAYPGTTILVGFALGANMSIAQLFQGGLSGVLLGLITALIVGSVTIVVDKVTGGTGVAGAAISSTAGSGIANPAALAAVDPTYALIAPIATSQIAASVIITAFLTPLLTGWVYKRNLKKAEEKGISATTKTVIAK